MPDDPRQQLDAIMDDASRALVAMDYLRCESLCEQALALAREAGDWHYYARVVLPLQEARRQRRMIAAEGTLRLGTADMPGHDPGAWLERLSPGCMVLTAPHTREQAGQLQQLARQRGLHVEVMHAEVSGDTWTLQGGNGPAVLCPFRAPPQETTGRWLSDPADGRRQDAAEWFIDATEALGDALIASVTSEEGSLQRVADLETCLAGLTDHEKLHQRLADAARAMTAQPKRIVSPPSRSRGAARAPSRGTFRRLLGRFVLFVVVLAVLLAGWAWWKWNRVPAHWANRQPLSARYSEAQVEGMGRTLEQQINNLINTTFVGDTTLEATVDEVNAWLGTRMRPWLANQNMPLPGEVGEVMFAIDPPQPIIAFELKTAEVSQVVSAYIDLKFDGTHGQFRVARLTGGELPIPAGLLVGHLEKSVPETYRRQVREFAQGLRGVKFDPVFELENSRTATVKAIAIEPDRVKIDLHVAAK